MADITLHSGSFCDRNNNEISITFFKKETAPQMTVEPTSLSYIAAGETKTLRVSGYTGTLSISVPVGWLSYTQSTSSGVRTYTLTATANTSTSVRSTTITLTDANNNPVTVEAVQAGTSSSISLSTSILSFGYGQETKTMTVTWSGGYTPTYSFPSWCTVTASGSTSPMTLTVTAAANTGDVRSAGVTFTNGISSANLQVTQQASATMYVLPNTLSFSSAGGSNTVTAYFTGSETLSYNIGSSGTGWLTGQAGTPSQGEQTFTFTASQNSSTSVRSATITFTYGNITSQVTVDQAGSVPATISVDKTVIDFSANVGTDTVTVTYSGQGYVSASGGTSWLDVTYKDQPTPTTVRFDIIIDQNTGSSRSATITFTGSLGGTATTTVNQSAAAVPWSVNPSTINNVAYSGGTYNLTFTGTPSIGMGYEVDPVSVDWVSANIQSLSAATVTVNANATTSQRSATVKFYKYDDHSTYVTVAVNQEGASPTPAMTVIPSTIDLSYKGAYYQNVSLSNFGEHITSSKSSNWLNSYYLVDGVYNIEIYRNNTGSSRTGTITYTDNDNGNTAVVTVTQGANTVSEPLTTSVSSVTFNASDGSGGVWARTNFTVYNIDRPCPYDWNASEDWCSVGTVRNIDETTEEMCIVCHSSNTSASARTATIQFTDYRQVYVSMAITQLGMEQHTITVNPSTISLNAAGNAVNMSVDYEGTLLVNDNANWLNLSLMSSSTGHNQYAVFASSNTSTSERTAQIELEDSYETVFVPVTQAGRVSPALTVSPTSIAARASLSTYTETITYPSEYGVSGSVNYVNGSNWITLDYQPVTGNTRTVNVIIEGNNSGSGRAAQILFEGEAGGSATVDVYQPSN